MMRRIFREIAVVAIGMSLAAVLGFSQTAGSARGPQPPAGCVAAGGSGNGGAEPCSYSPICAWGKGRDVIVHEQRKPDLGFTFAYPFVLPEGLTGGVSASRYQFEGTPIRFS